jgi:pheganomycin biosynthesis PGM1-like protein/pre ATP-grasp domain-containing protein/ATP-grasp domain-containing protein
MVSFEELQRTFAVRYPAGDPLDLGEGTVVVLPSLSFPTAELRKIVGIGYYEERLLFLLLLLRRPGVKIVYLTSMPVEDAVVDYYLDFLPDPAGARARLHMLAAGDPAQRSLTAKLLDRPELLDRVRELASGPGGAFVQPFNVTPGEQALAERLGLPLYGPPAALASLGSKTGSRRVARLAGVPVLDGAEDLRSVEAVEAAARDLRRRAVAPVDAVVIKLNDGFSGQGNAVVDLAGLNGSLVDSPVVFCAEEESWSSFAAKIAEGGAVVEELLAAPGMVSPSVQLRILPGGLPLVLSTHSQVLGGPNRQVYLGCRFPAEAGYRTEIRAAAERVARVLAARGVIGYFGVDFFVVPQGQRQRVYLAEINLRVGGTTHPFGMASLVTQGSYDAASGHLVAGGRTKSYLATDNLKSSGLTGRSPGEIIDELARRGLAYDRRRRAGATLHLLGALREYGKMGVTCIGDTAEEARQIYREVVGTLT